MRADVVQLRYTIDDVDCQSESIDLVFNRQFHRCVDVAALFVAAYVQVSMIRAAVRQTVNQPWIAMEVEDDRFVGGEQAVEIAIVQPVRMLAMALHLEEV